MSVECFRYSSNRCVYFAASRTPFPRWITKTKNPPHGSDRFHMVGGDTWWKTVGRHCSWTGADIHRVDTNADRARCRARVCFHAVHTVVRFESTRPNWATARRSVSFDRLDDFPSFARTRGIRAEEHRNGHVRRVRVIQSGRQLELPPRRSRCCRIRVITTARGRR